MISKRFAAVASAVLLISSFFSFSTLALEPIAVQVVEAHWQEYARPVRISGLLENKSEQKLAFKVAGLINQVNGFEGQWVEKGEVLASLDLAETNAQVAKAQSVLTNAEQNLKRYENLRGKNVISIEQLQAAQTQMEVARSDLTVAKFNQQHAVIRAPSSGRVLKRFVENNEMVAPGTPAFLFAPAQGGWVLRASVTDRDIVRLSLNDTAKVTLDTYPGIEFLAKVNELAARASVAQTFAIELKVQSQAEHPFLAGFIGKAEITPEKTRKVVLLPTTSIVSASRPQAIREVGVQSEVEIFVIKNNQAFLRKVPILAMENEMMVVSSGLEEGDRVVTTGALYLSEGRDVSVVQTVKQ